jgi:hypothetical protein
MPTTWEFCGRCGARLAEIGGPETRGEAASRIIGPVLEQAPAVDERSSLGRLKAWLRQPIRKRSLSTQTVSPSAKTTTHQIQKGTIGVFLILLIAIWGVSPILIISPTQLLVLTSTGYGDRFVLRLQNLGPWPMVVDGYWRFDPPIQWSDAGPATDFTLMPFTAYTFEYYMYCTGSCRLIGGETAPYVTLVGEVRLLYRMYQVEIRSTNWGRG